MSCERFRIGSSGAALLVTGESRRQTLDDPLNIVSAPTRTMQAVPITFLPVFLNNAIHLGETLVSTPAPQLRIGRRSFCQVHTT